MRFLINRRLHVNMGHYEHVEITGSVEVDTLADRDGLVDLDVEPGEPELVIAFIREQLEAMLAPDIEDARVHTDEEDSFIHPYAADRTTERKRK